MGAVTRDSVLYASKHTNTELRDARDGGGRMVPIPFEHTVVAGELTTDIINLAVLPANSEVVGMGLQTDGVGGVGTALELGDAADPNRFMLALDIDTELTVVPSMPFTGWRFRSTANTIVIGTWSVANPVAGNIFRGYFLIVPGA